MADSGWLVLLLAVDAVLVLLLSGTVVGGENTNQ
jgi:hypothetical protein